MQIIIINDVETVQTFDDGRKIPLETREKNGRGHFVACANQLT